MINYLNMEEGIDRLSQLVFDERLIPIFGAGFSKSSQAESGQVPDSDECVKLMRDLIGKYMPEIDKTELWSYDFDKLAKKMRKGTPSSIPKGKYLEFFKSNFTNVKLPEIKKEFLSLRWPYAFTINIDDGIEQTNLFYPILFDFPHFLKTNHPKAPIPKH